MAKKQNGTDNEQTDDVASDKARKAGQAVAGPVLYKSPVPLMPDRHGKKSLNPTTRFNFAKPADAVPLTITEFPLASRHYPIVIAGTDPAMALAVVGLRDRGNLFITDDGAWEAGAYIPAYVRRYPFVFLHVSKDNRFVLCIDEASERLTEADGQPLFESGEPTDVVKRALEFCRSYQQRIDSTQDYCALLGELGVLSPSNVKIKLKSGKEHTVGGFRLIDPKKLADLSDEAFLRLRKAQCLPAVYAQLNSTSNWEGLSVRAS